MENNKNLEKLLHKISSCIDYQCLYALEEWFNKVGLTVQTTSRNRLILCRLDKEGKVISDSVIDDYIFVGNLDELGKELSDRATQKISDFVRNHAGGPGKVLDKARVWRNGLRMYEDIIIVNEDVQEIADKLISE